MSIAIENPKHCRPYLCHLPNGTLLHGTELPPTSGVHFLEVWLDVTSNGGAFLLNLTTTTGQFVGK